MNSQRLSALKALCGFWEVLEAAAAGFTTGTHLLDALRRGDDSALMYPTPLYQTYRLAVWVSDVSGIAIEDAPLEWRMFNAFEAIKDASDEVHRRIEPSN